MTILDNASQLLRAFSHFIGPVAFDGPTRFDAIARNHTVRVVLADIAQAAATDNIVASGFLTVPAWMTDGIEITAVRLKPNAALTAHAANNKTITVAKHTAAGAGTTIATGVTTAGGTGSWVALTDVVLAVSATLATRSMAAGQQLSVSAVSAAAGVALPRTILEVEYREL